MADSQTATPAAFQQAIAELISEITFQKVLLSSIDDSVGNREAAEREVRQEIKTMEKSLRDLRRSEATASLPSSSQFTQPTSSSNVASGDTPRARGPLGVSENVEQHNNNDIDQGASDSTASTPKSAGSVTALTSPSISNLPTRKRSHGKHLDGGLAPSRESKSQRTSPSPRFGSPSLMSSGDDEFQMFDREFFQQQKAEEERIERERLDAEFARSIQNEPLDIPTIVQPASSTLSAFDRISGIRPLPSNSASSAIPSSSTWADGRATSGRKLPPTFRAAPPSATPQPRSTTSNIKAEQSSSSSRNNTTNFIGGKNTRNIPGSFLDDLSSDSEVEVIPSSAFRDNGRRHTSGPSNWPSASPTIHGRLENGGHPGFSSASQAPDSANDALRRAMYGKQHVPDWMALPGQNTPPIPGAWSNPPSTTRTLPMGAVYGGGTGQYTYPSNSFGSGSMVPGNAGLGNANYMGLGPAGTNPNYPGSGLMHSGSGLSGLPGVNFLTDRANGFASNRYGGRSAFDAFTDIIDITGSHSSGGPAYPRGYNEHMAEQYDYIVNDPRKTNEEIKELLENIQPDMDLSAENREGTPDGLKYPLYEHQKVALTWLKSMEDGSNKGGILADDMGLGKTISALALMLSRPSDDRMRKTTLIVGPVALVRQWEREIRTKIKVSHRLSTHMIHGQSKRLDWDQLRNFDIVLTTYGTLGAEYRRLEAYKEKHKTNRDMDQAPMRKLFPLLGPKSLFYRVILDEAQCIKNKNTIGARAACCLMAKYRFCLTGTPMMNNVGELFSLIHFLRIKPYNAWPRFSEEFGLLSKGQASRRDTKNAMRKLQAVIKAILLRRTKTTKLDGKPIIELPPKTEEIQHVVFSDDEQEFYKSLETKTQIQFNKYMKANTVGKNYSNILVLLLRLRQCCCHPHLITDFDEASPSGVQQSAEVMIELAKNLSPEVVGRLLAAEGFECPVCYDGVENPSIVIPCGHDTCAECLSKISDQAIQQNVAAGNEAGGASKCPTCRGKVEMDKIIDYATFKRVHMPDPNSKDEENQGDFDDSSDDDSSDTGSDSDSESDANSDGDLRNFIVPDDVDDEDAIKDDDDKANVLSKESKGKGRRKKEKRRKKDKGKGKEKGPEKEKAHLSLAMLKKGASQSAAGRRRYMRYLRKHWQPSAKVTKCVELLDQFQEDGQKTIVFSQFVSLLDLLQVPIEQKGWECERYDGSMSADARNDAITRFTDKPNCKMMLISLKAGNSGLNLVAASRVIILDPFWNPFIEMQAVDRAYRIGQQKEVEVHRILIESTVEDRIIELQEKKRKLVNSALDEGANKSLGRLDVRQLAFLFGVGDGNANA